MSQGENAASKIMHKKGTQGRKMKGNSPGERKACQQACALEAKIWFNRAVDRMAW